MVAAAACLRSFGDPNNDGFFVSPCIGSTGFLSCQPLTSEGCAGANGLAAARDFLTPVARFEERECDFTVLHKFNGQLFQAEQVSWRSSAYAPSGVVCC